jgi:hypothetical protein
MKSPADDLENRRPVWDALSDLFLDTELQASDHERIARVLAASPYSLDEIERILFYEVYPVCIPNLWCIAGEWAGFDPTWLEEQIMKRDRNPWKWPESFLIGRRAIRDTWQQVRERFEAI